MESVIIRVMKKSDDRTAEVRFVYHVYDCRLNWIKSSLQLKKSKLQFPRKKSSQVTREKKENCIKRLTKVA